MLNSEKAFIFQLIKHYIFVWMTHCFNGLQFISTWYPCQEESQLHLTRMWCTINAESLVHGFHFNEIFQILLIGSHILVLPQILKKLKKPNSLVNIKAIVGRLMWWKQLISCSHKQANEHQSHFYDCNRTFSLKEEVSSVH